MILRQCQHPTLVMDVLEMAVRPEVVGDAYRTLLQSMPYLSFNALLTPESDSLLMQTSRMFLYGRSRPSTPEYIKVSRQLQAMFEAALSCSTPVDEIVRRTAEFIGVISGRTVIQTS